MLDTGVAYRTTKRFRRSPDFVGTRFVRGYDFVDHDAFPDDENGHGTFVAGVIAERVNNGVGLTGTGLRRDDHARPRPRRAGRSGDAAAIAAGIRYAARRGAKIINLSLEFDSSVPGSQIPEVLERDPLRQPQGRARHRRVGQRGACASSPTRPAPTA